MFRPLKNSYFPIAVLFLIALYAGVERISLSVSAQTNCLRPNFEEENSGPLGLGCFPRKTALTQLPL